MGWLAFFGILGFAIYMTITGKSVKNFLQTCAILFCIILFILIMAGSCGE